MNITYATDIMDIKGIMRIIVIMNIMDINMLQT
jgi:hypothetical protein